MDTPIKLAPNTKLNWVNFTKIATVLPVRPIIEHWLESKDKASGREHYEGVSHTNKITPANEPKPMVLISDFALSVP